jgi:hypothetical protein
MDLSDIDKKSDPILELIEVYKKHLKENQDFGEIYKWKLLGKFKGRPDINAPDFYEEIKTISFSNLIYPIAGGVIKHIAKEKPEKYRKCFKFLFDESKPLVERMKFFREETLKIYREINENMPHHHDERTMATLLTYHNPEKYTFFKDSFYQDYCKLIGLEARKAGEKYDHYLKLIDDLVNKYINKDQELLDLINNILQTGYFRDENHKILAQDILFMTMDAEIGDKTKYWVFQGNPKAYDIIASLKEKALKTWTVSTHKDEIKIGDKVILWASGESSGCYALCTVTSEVTKRKDDDIELKYYKEKRANISIDRVEIKLDINLAEKPILKSEIINVPVFKDFKGGSQGTNFTATKEQYLKLLEMTENMNTKKYWIYAPGRNAEMWDEFYENGIMALGWDDLGDLNKYKSREELQLNLQEIYETEGPQTNNSLANLAFKEVISKGDVIIVKKGRGELLGYGVVTSDYFFDDNRTSYKSCRKVNWIKKGHWISDHSLVLKTLTDITEYPSGNEGYEFYYERLLGLMDDEKNTKKDDNMNIDLNYPLNQILFGPPGTGKTYNSIDKAVEIASPGKFNKDIHFANKLVFDELRKQGQIEFVTFHQNYSYEDFIVGISPDVTSGNLRFDKREGIFKQLAERAKQNWMASSNKKELKIDFNSLFNSFFSKLIEEEVKEIEIPMRSKGKKFKITSIDFENGKIKFTKNSGGTGHDLLVRNLKDIYEGNLNYSSEGLGVYYYPLIDQLNEYAKTIQLPISTDETLKNFVLVIDEINRANISKVFGELITLLEDDKRLGAENELKITLPNGERDFGIPPNLYIIGTMNTADKSIALIDIALRRRFEFIGYYPKYNYSDNDSSNLLKKINEAIYKEKKSADFLIGHAYFMKEQPVKTVLQNKVIPLLMEYFSGKVDIVSRIFAETGWNVSYDITDFKWIISEK